MKIPSSFMNMKTVEKTLTLFGKMTKGTIVGQQILNKLQMKESIISQIFSGRTLMLLLLK
jgi:hypothetical protein